MAFHQVGTPVLISATLLRERDLGQVDLVRLQKKEGSWVLEIAEVKSSLTGVLQMEKEQKRRLFSAQNFLSGLFGFPSRLIRLVG